MSHVQFKVDFLFELANRNEVDDGVEEDGNIVEVTIERQL